MLKKLNIGIISFLLFIGGISFAEPPKSGGILTIGRSGDSLGLDPAFETDSNSFMVCDNLFEQLVGYADDSTKIVPGLAESWEVSPDGLSYMFHLRNGVKFHDGAEMNADAVVFSIGRMMKEKKVVFFKDQWNFPQRHPNIAIYWQNMEMDKTLESIEAKDNDTVIFKLRRRDAPFIANMAMDFAAIVSPTAILKYGENFKNNPIGTGPFKFVKWIRDDRIILEANKEYRNGRPYPNQVIFKSVPDNSQRLSELINETIDISLFPNPDDIEAAKKEDKLKLISQPGMNIAYIGFNHTKALWQDMCIRQAFAHAINKKAIVESIYGDSGQTAKNTIPPTMWGYNDDIQDYPYHPELAKRLLHEAKFYDKLKETGQNRISLWTMSIARAYNPNPKKAAEMIQADLKNIGIDVQIVSVEWGTYLKKLRTQPQDMDLFQLGWNGDNGDPDNFLGNLLDGLASPNVRIQWKNEEYHNIIVQARQAVNKEDRIKLYHRAQEIIHEEVPLINMAHSMLICPVNQRVMNFKLHPTGSIHIKDVWVK